MLSIEQYYEHISYLRQLYDYVLGRTITQPFVNLITLDVLGKPCIISSQLLHLRNTDLILMIPEVLSPLKFFDQNLTFYLLACIKVYSFCN